MMQPLAGADRRLVPVLLAFVALVLAAVPALALNPIVVNPELDRIEITTLGEGYGGRGDNLMVETVAGADGVVGRMSVKAATPGTNPNWIVFALTNPTDKPIERWLASDRYTMAGSGVIWPDLDARRIEAVTPSIGFVPQRLKSDRADIFALTLEPGQTITYVAELSSERLARIYLWKPLEYEGKVRDRQLFNGIMLGLSVLAAVFLTVVFAANHKLIFPAAALLAWCVLAYLCVDFGFFHKLFNMKPEDNAVYRAAAESATAASLVMFLYAFLRLGLSHGLFRLLSLVWILAQLALVAVAAIDPRLASTFARFSFVAIGGIGALATLYLALRGQDRAMHLLPPWIMFLVWIFLAGVVLTGRLTGEIFVQALIGGLVMILLLIGFTVTQFAFRTLEPLAGLAPTDSQLRAIAVEGARAAVWEWSSRRDEIRIGAIVEQALGLNAGELNVKVDEFLTHIHPADRERFRLSLWSVQERAGGKIRTDFRMRHADNSYRWFELEAASVETGDRRSVRCVGLMRDVTDMKMSHERLLQDAVFCSLTGLPNRELLLDRLSGAIQRARTDTKVRPTIYFIDIDKFQAVNASLGYLVGDSLLLTVARRLQRHVGPFDTLARLGADRFAILYVDQQDPRELASLAERIRRSLRAPINIASQEVVLTGSLGIAIYDGEESTTGNLLKEAEIATYRAKRSGGDRVEIFRPEMRGEPNDPDTMEATIRKAVERGQIKLVYQPIVYLPTEQLAGFEALVRMEHAKLGLVSAQPFIPFAEASEVIHKLGSHVLTTASKAAAVWHKELPRPEDHLFVSVNIPSREVLRPDLAQEVRHLMARYLLAAGTMKLEISESLAMENPEHAVEMLGQLKTAGADLTIDEFGNRYSSLPYLQRMPADTIKLDRGLMRAAGSGDEAAVALVRAAVAMAHELGRKVVAEGVETAEDVVFLRSIGCEYGQGHFYGEPMLERDVIELLRIIRKSERKLHTHGFFKAKQREGRKRQRKAAAAEAKAAASTVAGGGGKPASDAPQAEGNTGLAADAMAANPSNPSNAAAAAPATPAGGSQSHGEPGIGAPGASLPQSMVRTRHRPATQPAAPDRVAGMNGASARPGPAVPEPPAAPRSGPQSPEPRTAPTTAAGAPVAPPSGASAPATAVTGPPQGSTAGAPMPPPHPAATPAPGTPTGAPTAPPSGVRVPTAPPSAVPSTQPPARDAGPSPQVPGRADVPPRSPTTSPATTAGRPTAPPSRPGGGVVNGGPPQPPRGNGAIPTVPTTGSAASRPLSGSQPPQAGPPPRPHPAAARPQPAGQRPPPAGSRPNGGGAPPGWVEQPPAGAQQPDFSALPTGIAASLARLAGVTGEPIPPAGTAAEATAGRKKKEPQEG